MLVVYSLVLVDPIGGQSLFFYEKCTTNVRKGQIFFGSRRSGARNSRLINNTITNHAECVHCGLTYSCTFPSVAGRLGEQMCSPGNWLSGNEAPAS